MGTLNAGCALRFGAGVPAFHLFIWRLSLPAIFFSFDNGMKWTPSDDMHGGASEQIRMFRSNGTFRGPSPDDVLCHAAHNVSVSRYKESQ